MRHHSRLFRWVCQFIKYFFLFSFGLAVFCVLASLFEAAGFALWVLHLVTEWWLRLAASALIFLGFAAMIESVG